MRSYGELRQILALWEEGLNKLQISKLTGIPRGTVQSCIDRYGSLARFEAIARLGTDTTKDETQAQVHNKRRYIISGYEPRKRGYTDEQLRQCVAESFSMAEVLRKLGLRPAGGNYDLLKRRIKQLNLDTAHFTGSNWLKGKKHPAVRYRAMEEILVKDSTYMTTSSLKKRLIAEGYFEAKCMSCELRDWLGQPIPLEIHHINGDRRDHRLENLHLLCPNCHALTPTYRGKNKNTVNS